MKILKKLMAKQNLESSESREAMEGIMNGTYTQAQMAALLVALAMKNESAKEIFEFSSVMRKHSIRIKPKINGILVDTCGTGGDLSNSFNISTASAIVAASAGVYIAKHGNRSVSSLSGSADAIEGLGMKILNPLETEKCIEATGFGFMFAPYFHPAMKNVMPVRKELGVKTVFNILGPLTNPANASAQVIGVYDKSLCEKMADVLILLGTKHALVVKSDEMDEFGFGMTYVCEVFDGKKKSYYFDSEKAGITKGKLGKCKGKDESAKIIKEVLCNKDFDLAAKDIVCLNAGAAIYVSGKSQTISEGVKTARQAIETGKAEKKLDEIIKFCNDSR